MDNDKYRRGKLSSHEFFDPGIAILAGDALLTYAFEITSKLNFESDKINKINNIISEGAGLNGMVAGQVLDLEGENNKLNLEELKLIHNHKTGALFKSSILAGAYCGEVIDKEIESLKNFAYHLGLLFQITDDILDVIGDEDKLGKKVGQDQKNNKSTYPGILGLKNAKKEAQNQAEQAHESLRIFGEKAVDLNLLVKFVLNRNF
jgi:geranylgeranyl diphosphate synthase type II